jgi:adenylate kinase family enzyme
MELGTRIVIIGNSGSGKTTLARELGRRENIPVTDLDRVHWQSEVLVKRDERIATGMVAELAARPRWVIEGVYGWLAGVALPFATALVWLDMPWLVCRDGLNSRGPWQAATDEEHTAFLEWAEAYWQRAGSSSFAGHRALFENFVGVKVRFETRAHLDRIFAMSRQISP